MQPLDLVVLCGYLAAMVAVGARCSGRQRNVRDYFLSGQQVPWWAVLGSIVATETSTVTLISIPGYAFGGDLTFLQLALGYVIGRIVVASVLVPRLFRGDLMTAYQPLAARFGAGVGRLTASIFLLTRSLSDGFRLFATGLVLAAVLATLPASGSISQGLLPGVDGSTALLVLSVGLIGVTTLAYTLLGGMTAVIWSDVIQLVVYMSGAAIAGLILLAEIPGGWAEVMTRTQPAGKARRLRLCRRRNPELHVLVRTGGRDVSDCRDPRRRSDVRAAVPLQSNAARSRPRTDLERCRRVLPVQPVSGDRPHALGVLHDLRAGRTRGHHGGWCRPNRPDLPAFMMTHLPTGIRGLVVASIVAAAMSTLSSSLNSSAASTVGDFYMPLTGETRSDRHYLGASRLATVVWAVVQMAVAVVAVALSSRVVDEVLGIQSFTGGLLLGVFLLALTPTRRSAAPATGIVVGATLLVALRLLTAVSWQWYVLVGTLTTFGVGWVLGRVSPMDRPRQIREPMTDFGTARQAILDGARTAFPAAAVDIGRHDRVLCRNHSAFEP